MLVFGPAQPATEDPAAAVDAVRRLVGSGAKPRVAAAVIGELTGFSANQLYSALTSPG